MTPKEHLLRVKVYFDLIRDTKMEIEILNSQLDGMSGMGYDKELVQTSLADTRIENQLILIEQKEKRLASFRKKYRQARREVSFRISGLKNERERKVLTLRYLRFMEWRDIFVEMKETQDIVFQIHKRALNHYPVDMTELDR